MSLPVAPDFYCPSCGASAFDDTTYCTGCGTDIRHVQKAMSGGLTTRQRRFISGLSVTAASAHGTVSLIAQLLGGAATAFDPLLVLPALIFVGGAGYVGYLLARDGSSPDTLFRVARPAPPPLRAASTQAFADDDTPTRRL